MKWTKESPKTVGFYWCHQRGSTRMVKVWKYTTPSLRCDQHLFTNEDGGSRVTDPELYDGAMWYGPIDPPSIGGERGEE